MENNCVYCAVRALPAAWRLDACYGGPAGTSITCTHPTPYINQTPERINLLHIQLLHLITAYPILQIKISLRSWLLFSSNLVAGSDGAN